MFELTEFFTALQAGRPAEPAPTQAEPWEVFAEYVAQQLNPNN